MSKSTRLLPIVIVWTGTLLCAVSASPAGLQSGSVSSADLAEAMQQARVRADSDADLNDALLTGELLLREKRFAEATEVFRSVLEKAPGESRALYGMALALFNLGKPAEAEPFARAASQNLKRAVSKGGPSVSREQRARAADAFVIQAVVQAVRGNDVAALKSAGQAVNIAPNHFDAQFTYGRALYSTGDTSRAIKAFRKAVLLHPSDARALFFLGTTLEAGGDLEGALSSYKQIIAKEPQAAEGHLGMGMLLVRRSGGEGEEGIKELERAVELNGNLYEARVALGRALVARGRSAESVAHLIRAAELAPGNPEPHFQLSLAYRRLGLKDKANQETAAVRRIHEARRSPKASRNAQSTPE